MVNPRRTVCKILSISVILLFFGIIMAPIVNSSLNKDKIYQEEKLNVDKNYIRHKIIYINGNDKFTNKNGVIGGKGTENDPYIISGWKLNGIFWKRITRNIDRIIDLFEGIIIKIILYPFWLFFRPTAFTIVNTDKHVIIRDNFFKNWDGYSIQCRNVKNISFENNIFSGDGDAIKLENVNNVTIDSNMFSDHGWGIRLYNSNNTNIRDNTFNSCYLPIANNGKNTYIEKNIIINCKGGIENFNIENVYIRGNKFSGMIPDYFYLIAFWDVKGDSIIEDSYIYDCNFEFVSGIHFLYTNNLVIIRNNTFEKTKGYTIIGKKGLIENNTLKNCDIAIKAEKSTIQYNHIKSCSVGVVVEGPCYITNNYIENNDMGIGCYWPSGSNPIILNNIIENNGIGIYCIEDSKAQVHYNSISGNDWGFRYEGGRIINATMNWWGAKNGPSGEGPGHGDTVDADIDYDPWLTSPYT
jgi:parallel beta-helix repeat protein